MKLAYRRLLVLFFALPPIANRGDDPLPIRFLLSEVRVSEAESVARLEVIRADDADHSIRVEFFTEPLTATAGVDYTPLVGTLTFAPGEHFKLINIPIINDGI